MIEVSTGKSWWRFTKRQNQIKGSALGVAQILRREKPISQQAFFLLRAAARAASPMPKRIMASGSGAGARSTSMNIPFHEIL